jgi:hypothetical protein
MCNIQGRTFHPAFLVAKRSVVKHTFFSIGSQSSPFFFIQIIDVCGNMLLHLSPQVSLFCWEQRVFNVNQFHSDGFPKALGIRT